MTFVDAEVLRVMPGQVLLIKTDLSAIEDDDERVRFVDAFLGTLDSLGFAGRYAIIDTHGKIDVEFLVADELPT